ncbi:hypothetical protein C8Q80DRAFT_321280 [Daedaleopsis nitida]|nr:hypothetical protein C8Q80DRAFT_321280 [Daedaleopsis nitida]
MRTPYGIYFIYSTTSASSPRGFPLTVLQVCAIPVDHECCTNMLTMTTALLLAMILLDPLVLIAAVSVLASCLTTVTAVSNTTSSAELILPHNPAQCETVLISWTGGSPNFSIVVSYNPPNAKPPNGMETFANFSARSVEYTADVCAGTIVAVELFDRIGFVNRTDFVLAESADVSCLASDAPCVKASASAMENGGTSWALAHGASLLLSLLGSLLVVMECCV